MKIIRGKAPILGIQLDASEVEALGNLAELARVHIYNRSCEHGAHALSSRLGLTPMEFHEVQRLMEAIFNRSEEGA